MADTATHVHLAIDYIEISVTDVAVAKRFYAQAFGWTFTDYGPDYAGFKDSRGGAEAGGLARVDSVAVGGPLVVLYSNELQATFDAVEGAGGRITKAIFEFPGGKRFQFADPSGNELAVWSER
ncbi:MAG: VOC family protein [Polyangiales bacterium]|nr:VOC family protein [Myxococcales bacterium]